MKKAPPHPRADMKEKQTFEERYARDSGYESYADLAEYMIAVPCACGWEGCEGWAMVSRDCVDAHLDLYGPRSETLKKQKEKI